MNIDTYIPTKPPYSGHGSTDPVDLGEAFRQFDQAFGTQPPPPPLPAPPATLGPDEQNEIIGIFAAMLRLPTADGGNKRARGEKVSWKVDPEHLGAAYRHLDPSRPKYDEDSGCHKYIAAAWRLLGVAYQEMRADGLVQEDPK